MVHVEEAVLAEARARRDGVFHTDAEVVRTPPDRAGAGRARSCGVGKMVDTMLAHDGTDFAGSRCVMTKRASG